MAQAAFTHSDQLLGRPADRECSLNLDNHIEPCDLTSLDAPFSHEEIWNAVKLLPARKAPGTDGFTAEFLRACWSTIRQDILDVFRQSYELRGSGFCKLNQPLVTLLPKRADARKFRDYRPICLIHLMAKISRDQNAFIPNLSLHDNFVLVRQSLKLLHQLKAPRIMLKQDLTRAFDSISWPFLFEVLARYGFGTRFREWLAILLATSSTRIMLNGEPSPPIWLRCGLRQGDPMSPQLFVLAVDTLSRLIRRTHDRSILRPLHHRRDIPAISLYADDFMVFCHATQDDVAAIKGIHTLGSKSTTPRAQLPSSMATPTLRR